MADIIDAPQSQLDSSVKLFDSFYNFEMNVSANQYDIVYSYFYETTKSKNIAQNFTTIIFRLSSITGENVMTMLEYLQGKSKLEANVTLAYYLNSIKSKTTLYGVSIVPKPNEMVQRNIVV